MINRLINEMIDYYRGDAKRIQNFVKVYEFAKLIGEGEELDERTKFILNTAAVVHDIGIKSAEKKYGDCCGCNQEKEGPPIAKEMLGRLGFDNEVIDRVCYLVGHHHTYTDVDGIDYRILIEADFLVNLYEDNVTAKGIKSAFDRIFVTRSGRNICLKMFDINNG